VKRRLGILGTLVWDRIWRLHTIRGGGEPLEDWGGIAYSWNAVSAALDPGWEAVPLLKVGADLAPAAIAFLSDLPGMRVADNVRVVPEPTNRVELHYTSESDRTERLTGGVPPWSWDELAPHVAELDALYVNFISGFEMELRAAEALRAGFSGPIYVDLHSLFLARLADGRREPRSLPEWRRWVACFDGIQLNESELRSLVGDVPDPTEFVRSALQGLTGLVIVTLGAGGVAYLVDPELPSDPLQWHAFSGAGHRRGFRAGTVPPADGPLPGDPTGCGDVWGGAFIASLLGGRSVAGAARRANAAAARKLSASGATGLHDRLRDALAHA
jgi:sugar/nucleoside kinase (ribokinase family)